MYIASHIFFGGGEKDLLSSSAYVLFCGVNYPKALLCDPGWYVQRT